MSSVVLYVSGLYGAFGFAAEIADATAEADDDADVMSAAADFADVGFVFAAVAAALFPVCFFAACFADFFFAMFCECEYC